MKRLITVFFLIALLPTYAHSYAVYVHSVNAAIYKKPTMKSKKIIKLKEGDKVNVIREKGAWFQVKTKRGKGWVYKFMVNKAPVTKTEKLYSRLRSFFYKIESVSGKSRRRPSSYTATAAARGLREKRKHFAEKYNADYESLEKIESIEISNEQALEFLRQGVKK